jgi:hypothetical protein
MSKKPVSEQEWRIFRIRGERSEYVDHVSAPDADTAIKKAIVAFDVSDAEDR